MYVLWVEQLTCYDNPLLLSRCHLHEPCRLAHRSSGMPLLSLLSYPAYTTYLLVCCQQKPPTCSRIRLLLLGPRITGNGRAVNAAMIPWAAASKAERISSLRPQSTHTAK